MKSHSNFYRVGLKAPAEYTGNASATLGFFFFHLTQVLLLLKLSSAGIHQCPFSISLKHSPKRTQRQVIFSYLSFMEFSSSFIVFLRALQMPQRQSSQVKTHKLRWIHNLKKFFRKNNQSNHFFVQKTGWLKLFSVFPKG